MLAWHSFRQRQWLLTLAYVAFLAGAFWLYGLPAIPSVPHYIHFVGTLLIVTGLLLSPGSFGVRSSKPGWAGIHPPICIALYIAGVTAMLLGLLLRAGGS